MHILGKTFLFWAYSIETKDENKQISPSFNAVHLSSNCRMWPEHSCHGNPHRVRTVPYWNTRSIWLLGILLRYLPQQAVKPPSWPLSGCTVEPHQPVLSVCAQRVNQQRWVCVWSKLVPYWYCNIWPNNIIEPRLLSDNNKSNKCPVTTQYLICIELTKVYFWLRCC